MGAATSGCGPPFLLFDGLIDEDGQDIASYPMPSYPQYPTNEDIGSHHSIC